MIFTPIFVFFPYGIFAQKPIFKLLPENSLMLFADFCRLTFTSKNFDFNRKRYIVKKVGEKEFYEN